MPGSMAAAGHIAQLPRDSQRDQCRPATPWCFPLAPESGPQSQPDPASESDQHLGRLAEAEIAAPAPHIRSQLFHYRLHAGALGRGGGSSGQGARRVGSLSLAALVAAPYRLKERERATAVLGLSAAVPVAFLGIATPPAGGRMILQQF